MMMEASRQGKVSPTLLIRASILSMITLLLVRPSQLAARPDSLCPETRPVVGMQATMVMFDEEKDQWQSSKLTARKGGTLVKQFGEQDIWICISVKPDQVRNGALSVKVSRFFRTASSVYFTKTAVYRGSGFLSRSGDLLPPFEAVVSRREYVDFHNEGRIHPVLQREFHAYWDKQSGTYTLAHPWRRSLFLFLPDADDAKSLQTSYLLHYTTTELGSWIPFNFGTGGRDADQLERVLVVITDLGANRLDAEIKRLIVKKD